MKISLPPMWGKARMGEVEMRKLSMALKATSGNPVASSIEFISW